MRQFYNFDSEWDGGDPLQLANEKTLRQKKIRRLNQKRQKFKAKE